MTAVRSSFLQRSEIALRAIVVQITDDLEGRLGAASIGWQSLTRSIQGNAETLQDQACQPLTFAHEAKQEVLGADIRVARSPCLVLREDADPPGTLGEPLEHNISLVAIFGPGSPSGLGR
jgi:hypothetical protein